MNFLIAIIGTIIFLYLKKPALSMIAGSLAVLPLTLFVFFWILHSMGVKGAIFSFISTYSLTSIPYLIWILFIYSCWLLLKKIAIG
ncbi:hypothetical protein [Bacillus sp. EAC]|uniref:hypothetical protein n=1 Tax=Bacillus sp. EAC TaxID=1978338 RepID=UPI000B453D82|nr:hypothetical protein [Bacillus sp. EAC]